MTLFQITLLLCWGIFLFYWFINWGKVKPTLEQKFTTMRIRAIIFGIIILLLLARLTLRSTLHLPSCQWSWAGCHYHFFSSSIYYILPLQIVGVILAVIGLGVAIVARKELADNWSSTLDLKKGHELVTTGVYSYVRHPIYTGVLLMLLGTLLCFLSISELVIILSMSAVFLFRIKKEEELMTKTFPKDYPAYRKRTKTLIPFIW